MNKVCWALVGWCSLMVVACKRPMVSTSITSSAQDSINIANQQALASLKVNELDFMYFHSKSKVDFQDGQNDVNGHVNCRIRKDSVIWLSITGGPGVEGMRCLIRPDSIFVLQKLGNQSFKAFTFKELNEQLNVQVNFYTIQALLVGNLPYSKSMNDQLVNESALGFLVLKQVKENLRINNHIRTDNNRLEQVEMRDSLIQASLNVKYGNFAPLDSTQFAYQTVAKIQYKDKSGSERNTSITLDCTKAEVGSRPLNFPFNIPKKYEDK